MNLRALRMQFTLPIVLLVLYTVVTALINNVYLPSPWAILQALGSWLSDGGWRTDVIPSLRNLFFGFAIGTAAGAILGLALGMVVPLRQTFEPLATFLRSIPPIALIPILMLALGLGTSMRVSVIAVGAFFPVLVNAIDGAAQLEHTLRDMARVYHIKLTGVVKDIVLPGALPQILAGMKVSLTIAIIMIFTSELRGATEGIGAFIQRSERFFDIPSLWAGTIFLGLLGFLLTRLFVTLENRLLAWRG